MPDTGSSSSSIDGFAASARATPSRRWSPYGRAPPSSAARRSIPTSLRISQARSAQLALRCRDAGSASSVSPQRRSAAAMQADQDVLENRVVRKHAGALERPNQAERRDLVRLESGERPLPDSGRSPSRRPLKAGDDVERRRLAGAVRADQPDGLALRDREVQVGDGDEPAEAVTLDRARRSNSGVHRRDVLPPWLRIRKHVEIAVWPRRHRWPPPIAAPPA